MYFCVCRTTIVNRETLSSFLACWGKGWGRWRRNVNISFVIPVLPCACKQLGSHKKHISEILYWGYLLKYSVKIKALLKSDKMTGTLHKYLTKFVIICYVILIWLRRFSVKFCKEYQNTRLISKKFCRKSRLLRDNYKRKAQPDRS